MRRIKVWLPVVGAMFFLSSCLGARADITIRADGSGSIALEYRVSQMLESMGRLEGNEYLPAIPVGKTDIQRSIARIPGLRLVSFSAKNARNAQGGWDLVTRARVTFKNSDALLAFLDCYGAHASLVQGEKNILRLTLLEPAENHLDADLVSLLQDISAGYEIRFNFTLPRPARITLIPASTATVHLSPQGKKVSAAIALGNFFDLKDGLALEVIW